MSLMIFLQPQDLLKMAKENTHFNLGKNTTMGQHQDIPEPTYWPLMLAFGITFLFWGILTYWIISAIGLVVMVISLRGWINLVRKEIRADVPDDSEPMD